MPGRLQLQQAAGKRPFAKVTLISVFQAMLLTAPLSSTKTVPSLRWVGLHVHHRAR